MDDAHAHLAENAIHRRISLLFDNLTPLGTAEYYHDLAEICEADARLHAAAGDRAMAAEATRKSDRFKAMAGDRPSRWLGEPRADELVPETFRDECGRVRRTIEDIVRSSNNTRLYIQTAPGLTRDHRLQVTEIYNLASGGVHRSRDGVTLMFDTDDALAYLQGVKAMSAAKPDWRTRGERIAYQATPSAFQDTMKLRSCRAKRQTATLRTAGW